MAQPIRCQHLKKKSQSTFKVCGARYNSSENKALILYPHCQPSLLRNTNRYPIRSSYSESEANNDKYSITNKAAENNQRSPALSLCWIWNWVCSQVCQTHSKPVKSTTGISWISFHERKQTKPMTSLHHGAEPLQGILTSEVFRFSSKF